MWVGRWVSVCVGECASDVGLQKSDPEIRRPGGESAAAGTGPANARPGGCKIGVY